MTVRNLLIGALAAATIGLAGADAQERLEIFDAHMHYNQEPTPFYALDKVLEVFRCEGKLTSEWRALFERHSDRFLLGSDTWINERWFGYDTIFKEYRGWLAQLPAEQARRIASDNALRLFGPRPPG